MKTLMVLTSHGQLGNTGRKTGFWLEEFAAPYFVFRDAGVIRETARILGTPNGTVKARSARARKKLTQLMQRALPPGTRHLARASVQHALAR